MAKLLLAGYLGCGNLGDDAILAGFLEGIGNRPYEVSLLSGDPDETYRQYKVMGTPRKDRGAIAKAIADCDALVFPGGSIFQDSTSWRSVLYYSWLVKSAKSAGKRVVMLGQGVGPLKGTCAKRWARQAFEAADAIAVRDPGSFQTLKGLGIQKSVPVTADLAFLLPPPLQDSASTEGFNVGSMRTVGIAARPLGKGPEIADLFAEFARILFAQNHMPVLIEMDRNEDGPLIQEINKRNGGKVPDLRKLGRPQQVQTRIARMDAVVAVRLHAGILASTVGVPPFMVSYDPKVAAFARLMDLPSLPVEGLTATRLYEGFKEFMGRRDAVVVAMEKRRAEQAALAAQNFDLLDRVLGTKTPAPSGV